MSDRSDRIRGQLARRYAHAVRNLEEGSYSRDDTKNITRYQKWRVVWFRLIYGILDHEAPIP